MAPRAWGIKLTDWVDGVLLLAEIWQSPVEVGTLSLLITGFLYMPGGEGV